MNDSSKTNGEPRVSDVGLELPGDRDLRSVLRGALAEPEEEFPDLTKGVQQKIRTRSGGKFFADGWSTVKHPPLNTYLVTSLMMLFVLGIIYALLAPLSGAPAPARAPKPVQVVPTPR